MERFVREVRWVCSVMGCERWLELVVVLKKKGGGDDGDDDDDDDGLFDCSCHWHRLLLSEILCYGVVLGFGVVYRYKSLGLWGMWCGLGLWIIIAIGCYWCRCCRCCYCHQIMSAVTTHSHPTSQYHPPIRPCDDRVFDPLFLLWGLGIKSDQKLCTGHVSH